MEAAAKPGSMLWLRKLCAIWLCVVIRHRDVKWHKDNGAAPLSDFMQNVVINFLLITACLRCNGPFAVLLFSGDTETQQSRVCHILGAEWCWWCRRTTGPPPPCIIVHAQCKSRHTHTHTATSLVSAARRLATGKRPDCTVQRHWHCSQRFGTDSDKWASGASNIGLFLTRAVTVWPPGWSQPLELTGASRDLVELTGEAKIIKSLDWLHVSRKAC